MGSRDLDQLRARLVSLRQQRNRMVHRTSELERGAVAEVEGARAEVDRLRAELASARRAVVKLRPEVEAFERGRPPADDESAWRATWHSTAAKLAQVDEARSALETSAAVADRRLQQALADQEAVSADHARTVARVEHEIAELTREVGRLQAERPPVEAPDPQFRDVLIGRLQNLEAERSWISEEIAVREERMRRISAEVGQVRALLDMHTPDWGRAALESLAPEPAADRSVPAWKQGVLEILEAAIQPLHYREIAEQLSATGRSLGGQDPAETLLAALGRDRDFVRVGRGTYWLRTRAPVDRSQGAQHD